jgi:hypothetical protein
VTTSHGFFHRKAPLRPTDRATAIGPPSLDESTVDRLLSGAVAVDDAPPGYASVVRALDALRAPATAQEACDPTADVQAILAALGGQHVPRAAHGERAARSRKVVQPIAATLIGSLVLLGGLAGANALPGGAQAVAHDMLGALGVTVPDANDVPAKMPDGQWAPPGLPHVSASLPSAPARPARPPATSSPTSTTGVPDVGSTSGPSHQTGAPVAAPTEPAVAVAPAASSDEGPPPDQGGQPAQPGHGQGTANGVGAGGRGPSDVPPADRGRGKKVGHAGDGGAPGAS